MDEPAAGRGPRGAQGQPLEVLLIGDSLINTIADGFGRTTDGRDEVRWTTEVRISTGLARPDVLDWPRHLEQQLALHDPDVVVPMLGSNDDQSLTGAADDRRRGDRRVVWPGLPAMRPDKLERTRPTMRTAVERAVVGTEVVLLDTEPIVSPDG